MTELNAQPDASPAEELRAAAAKLRETASNATKGLPLPWHIEPSFKEWLIGSTDPEHLVTSTATKPVADWIALMSPEAAEPLADLLDSIAAVHEQPPCDAPETCNRCAEPDSVIIDALRVVLELTGRTA